MPIETCIIRARNDPTLHAIVDELEALAYAGGGSAGDDLPGHVRAASAVRRVGDRLVIIQDDVNALALHGAEHDTRPLRLPRGADGRRVFDDVVGNKAAKMDLEACAALPDGRLVAFGSGTSPGRESLVVLSRELVPVVVSASALYAELRAHPAFAGSELNIEGAVAVAEDLLLVQRGNGAPRGGVVPVNAIGALDLDAFVTWLDRGGAVPRLRSVVQIELGELRGAIFGLTDATAMNDGRLAILACAEASPDAVSDGPVAGCRFGLLDGDDLRTTAIVDERGRELARKLEGIEHRPGTDLDFDVVIDVDDASSPAELGRLRARID